MNANTNHNTESMVLKTFLPLVLESIKKQGLSFLILLAGIWYMQNQVSQLQQQINECNEQRILIYKEERQQMTEAIKDLKRILTLYIDKGK